MTREELEAAAALKKRSQALAWQEFQSAVDAWRRANDLVKQYDEQAAADERATA